MVLKSYKTPSGLVNFTEVLKIPNADRIYGLVQRNGYKEVHKILCGAIQVAMEALNLSTPLSAAQVVDLADELIESSEEDNLALEDIVLFLQKMVRGEAGKLFSQMDIAGFMNLFEKYRQDRHIKYLRIKEEQDAQYKALPVTERFSEERDAGEKNAFREAMKNYMVTQHIDEPK